ncbi:hypothetical protein [Chryseobacterium salivictor]|uniref:Uncharacterized protein n=1 Tax=Chryseobacterium salivictor TaxID=2547600 RepID=A0A4P6ZGU0_9FLAO|nr:hypothetical protein [Chryseobacterium salivictor]QBO58802.1 hypothetical protein NBC122_01994 [Chryseobacterium salivictor]
MKKLKSIYYILLVICFLIVLSLFSIESLKYSGLLTIPILVYAIVPLILILLLIILILNFKDKGFLHGVNETSPQIFLLLIIILGCFGLYKFDNYRNNKIKVEFTNKTAGIITDIRLVGRSAQTTIEKLNPKQTKIELFRGKEINYNTENDYDNEVKLFFFYKNKLSEVQILKGFNRWMVIDDNWKIDIIDSDSINVDIHNKNIR